MFANHTSFSTKECFKYANYDVTKMNHFSWVMGHLAILYYFYNDEEWCWCKIYKEYLNA
jgi:hypothetical protein